MELTNFYKDWCIKYRNKSSYPVYLITRLVIVTFWWLLILYNATYCRLLVPTLIKSPCQYGSNIPIYAILSLYHYPPHLKMQGLRSTCKSLCMTY